MSQSLAVPGVVLLVAASIAAVTDVWKFKVHNGLTFPLLASGLAYHGIADGWSGLGASALGVLFGFAVLLVPYAMGGVGGGDVKFMAGVGAWLGVSDAINVFVIAALAGGVYGVALILLSGKPREALINLQILLLRLRAFGLHVRADERVEDEVKRSDRRRRLIPFAAMVALGVVATTLFSWNLFRP
jgi:prepilin peptidase CpaA